MQETTTARSLSPLADTMFKALMRKKSAAAAAPSDPIDSFDAFIASYSRLVDKCTVTVF